MIKHETTGFTLTELIIAMALFSFILLFAVMAFIQVNKIYVKGITLKRMNDQARVVLNDVSRDIQQHTAFSPASPVNEICFSDGVAYSWTLNDPGKLSRGTVSSCSGSGDTIENAQNLIDGNTSVQLLSISPSGVSGSYKIDLVLSTQNQDQLTGTGSDITCKGDIGDQYCGVVHLSTVVRPSN
jgi:prepilin-type N-terminal cleavage/methylation domain-containing protein